jgi:hypothetical protein
LPQARCIVFIPAFYYPAVSYTEDADSFYLYPLAGWADSSKLALMSNGCGPASCYLIPFCYHVFDHALAVGEGCEPFIDDSGENR